MDELITSADEGEDRVTGRDREEPAPSPEPGGAEPAVDTDEWLPL